MKLIFLLIASFALLSSVVNSQLPAWGLCPPPLTHRNTLTQVEDDALGYMYITAPNTPFVNCTLPCQSMFYEDTQWESFNRLTKGMGPVSFALSVLVMITYGPLINRHFFKFDRHTCSIFFLAMATAFIGIADLMFVKQGTELICPEKNRYARQHDDKCLAQGIMYHFGWLGAVIFWAVFAVDNALRVAGKQGKKVIFGIAVAVLYSIIVILTFIPISDEQYGYYPVGVNSCWVLDKNWQYGVMWWVVVVSLAVGFVSICFSIFSLIKRTSDGNNSKFVMPLVMIILFFFQILYMICFYGVINDRKDQYTDILKERITCLLNAAFTHLTEPNPIQYCPFEHSIGFASQYTFSFFVKVLGIQVFVFLGLSKESLLLWKSSWLLTALGLGDKDAYEVELDEA